MAPKKSGQITGLEPEGIELVEAFPHMAQNFNDVGWFDFFSTFEGHEEQISMIFAQNFDGFKYVVGKLLMHIFMKENSPATRITRVGKRKLQTQQAIGDLPMGKFNEKGTTSRGKKLKMDEETDIHFDSDIKKEPNEP